MKEKTLEFLNFILVIMLLIVMFVSSLLLTFSRSFTLKDYSFCLIIIGIIGLITYIVGKIKNFKFTKFEIVIFILMAFSILSLFTAININDALFGKVNRREGLFVVLTYYILALNCMSIKNRKYIKIIFISICLYAFMNILYGLFHARILETTFFPVKKTWRNYAAGFLGNSMYFGTLMSIFYGLSIGLFMKISGIKKKIVSYILVLISSLGLIISGAMSAFVAAIFINLVMLYHIVTEFIKKEKDWFYHLLLLTFCFLSFVLILLIICHKNTYLKNDIYELIGETKLIVTGTVKEDYGTGRIHIWKNTIDKIIERGGIGVGVDNYYNAFDGKLIDIKTNLRVDKAHNDYLQKILCEGIISGIVFVIFLCVIFFKCLSKNLSSIYYGLYLAFTSYSVQAFFNISVTRVAPIYFIIIGLLLGINNEKYDFKVELSKRKNKKNNYQKKKKINKMTE